MIFLWYRRSSVYMVYEEICILCNWLFGSIMYNYRHGLSNSEHEVYVFLLLVTSEVYMTCSILDMFSKIIPKCCLDFSIRCWVDPVWKCWRHGPTGRGENHWSREEHHSAETVRGKVPLILKVKYQVLSEGGFHSAILNSITGVSNLIRLRSSYSY